MLVQADLLSVSRASLYYQPAPPSSEEMAVKRRIDEIYTAWPFYDSRRIREQLGREGQVVNRKAVQRHMQEVGLIALGPRPGTSRRSQKHAVYPYLLRNLRSGWPNHIWGIDITYIRLGECLTSVGNLWALDGARAELPSTVVLPASFPTS